MNYYLLLWAIFFFIAYAVIMIFTAAVIWAFATDIENAKQGKKSTLVKYEERKRK